jgi:hypothetical protein
MSWAFVVIRPYGSSRRVGIYPKPFADPVIGGDLN